MQEQIKFNGFEEEKDNHKEKKVAKNKKSNLKSNEDNSNKVKSKDLAKGNTSNKKSKITPSATKKSTKGKKNTAKNTSSVTKNKTNRTQIRFTAEEMDMLSEIYDWYLSVRDNEAFSIENIDSKKIEVQNDIIKEKKRVNITLDKEIWSDFEIISENIGIKKNELLTKVINDFIISHKDLF